MIKILYVKILYVMLLLAVIITAEVWFPVFVGFENNGQSVYESWKTPSLCNELPTVFKVAGKGKHVIDHWSEINVKMVKVELYKHNKQVAWMTFNGVNTNHMDWFSKSNLYQSSFTDLSQCSTTNFFSIDGDCVQGHHCRRMYINKVYPGCPNDVGWFSVLESNDICKWAQFSKYPVFIYTTNGGNWEKDSATADTLVVSIKTDL